MSVLLNLIWIFLAGLWLFLCYLLIGLSFCATIIGIPMGLVSMMIGVQMLMPFGKNVVPRSGGSPGCIGLLLACFLDFDRGTSPVHTSSRRRTCHVPDRDWHSDWPAEL